MAHNSEVQSRIDRARMHYETRASRRPVGLSQSDNTKYDGAGKSRPGKDTLEMRQNIALVSARGK